MMRGWLRRGRAVTKLAGLSERTLRDFDVTGADAIYLSNKSFWKE